MTEMSILIEYQRVWFSCRISNCAAFYRIVFRVRILRAYQRHIIFDKVRIVIFGRRTVSSVSDIVTGSSVELVPLHAIDRLRILPSFAIQVVNQIVYIVIVADNVYHFFSYRSSSKNFFCHCIRQEIVMRVTATGCLFYMFSILILLILYSMLTNCLIG